jgi:hypothetical protein
MDGAWIERPSGSGRELCWFPDPLGAKDCYRADMVDPHLLVKAFPMVERVSARLSATRRDRLTARLPMMRPPHPEGGLGGVRVEVRGDIGRERVTLVAGATDRIGNLAAQVAARFTLLALDGALPTGVVVPGMASLDNAGILTALDEAGVRFGEFVGTDARSA